MPYKVIGVSMPPEVLAHLDRKVKELNNQRGITRLSRSQVITALIEDFLKEALNESD